MASPTGGDFRSTFVGPALSGLERDVTLVLAAIESHESSYTEPHYTTITDGLADAITAIHAAAVANGGSNPDPE